MVLLIINLNPFSQTGRNVVNMGRPGRVFLHVVCAFHTRLVLRYSDDTSLCLYQLVLRNIDLFQLYKWQMSHLHFSSYTTSQGQYSLKWSLTELENPYWPERNSMHMTNARLKLLWAVVVLCMWPRFSAWYMLFFQSTVQTSASSLSSFFFFLHWIPGHLLWPKNTCSARI